MKIVYFTFCAHNAIFIALKSMNAPANRAPKTVENRTKNIRIGDNTQKRYVIIDSIII